MAFLVLSGTTIRARSNAVSEKNMEHGVDRERMFSGEMRITKRGDYRKWQITSQLTSADAATLIAILKSTSLPLLMQGDLCGDDCAVMPEFISNDPIQTAQGFRRLVTYVLDETPDALPPDTSASPILFLNRGIGLWQDTGKTTPALDTDRIRLWEDQSGNGNDIIAGGDNLRPTRDGLAVRFGVNPDFVNGRSTFQISGGVFSGYSAMEIMAVVKAVDDPPASDNTAVLWDFPTGGSTTDSGPTLFPATTGQIAEGFCKVGDRYRFSPSMSLSDAYVVYNVGISATQFFANLNGISQHTAVPGGGGVDFADLSTCRIGESAVAGHGNYWMTKLVINPAIFTASQRRSWYDFMVGTVEDPPLP